MTWHPNAQPPMNRLGSIGRPQPDQAHAPHYALVETLIQGLHITEMSFDYVRAYQHPSPVFGEQTRDELNRAIWYEAQQTTKEFNEIARHIGGIPVKMEYTKSGSAEGRVISLENYEQGAWTFKFITPYFPDHKVRGTSEALRNWYHATAPEELVIADEITSNAGVVNLSVDK